MHRIEGLAIIFVVVLLLGIFVFWMHTIRHNDIGPTLERLIEAGYTIEEILQHPDVARINRRRPGLFPNLDDWTEDDLQRARAHIETLPPARAATNVLIDAYGRLIDHNEKRIAVYRVIIAAKETHMEGPEPFTIQNSLPAAVRTEVKEAFGDDADAADAVLLQIEEAFADPATADRVIESHGGTEGFIGYLLESLSAPTNE